MLKKHSQFLKALPTTCRLRPFTCLGVLFSLFYSLTVIPAMLTLINPSRLVSRQREARAGSSLLAAWFARLALAVVRRRCWVVGLVVIIIALTPLGAAPPGHSDSWIDGFDRTTNFAARRMTGK